MSKSVIALIVTWFLVGLIGAFLGGYYFAKKNVCKIDDKNGGNVLIDNKELNNTLPTSPATPSSTTNTLAPSGVSNSSNSGQTVVQPTGQE